MKGRCRYCGRPTSTEVHEHIHDHGDGRRYVHSHPYPCCDRNPLAAKPHTHDNGVIHSHPHPETPA